MLRTRLVRYKHACLEWHIPYFHATSLKARCSFYRADELYPSRTFFVVASCLDATFARNVRTLLNYLPFMKRAYKVWRWQQKVWRGTTCHSHACTEHSVLAFVRYGKDSCDIADISPGVFVSLCVSLGIISFAISDNSASNDDEVSRPLRYLRIMGPCSKPNERSNDDCDICVEYVRGFQTLMYRWRVIHLTRQCASHFWVVMAGHLRGTWIG